MIEPAQILLLDQNLQIVFSQEQERTKTYFQELRQLISEALHNNYSHLVPLKDDEGYTMAFKSLPVLSNTILVLICKTDSIPVQLIRLNALLEDCSNAISAFYSTAPDWMSEVERSKLHGVAHLASRRFLKLTGLDAPKFLQGLTTNDLSKLSSRSAGQYSALLNAQGRMMYDVFIYRSGDSEYYMECDGQIQERVYLHLQTYNLRTKAKIEMVEGDMSVAFSSIPLEGSEASVKDSRTDWPFSRYLFSSASALLASINNLPSFTEGRYHRERIFKGVPEGAFEIASRQAIPMEFNVDLMGGIDFNKGCYLGQELVTRTHHRGVVRKRVLPLRFHALHTNTVKPIRIDPFECDLSSPLTKNLDKQNEFLPTLIEPDGKLKITSRTEGVGKHIMSQGNIGIGMMRLDALKDPQFRTNLATLDHVESDWILADALIPEWWPETLFNDI